MKKESIVLLLIFSSCYYEKKEITNNIVRNSELINNITRTLEKQQSCWNNGDIDGFMQGYWNSEELIFTSATHQPAYGWKNTLERYRNSYPTKKSMGQLNLTISSTILTSDTTALVDGSWELTRINGNPKGFYYLNLKKINNNWLITKDSTVEF